MKRILIIIPLLLLLTSCKDSFTDSVPRPQPVQSENISQPEITNTTNTTTADAEELSMDIFTPRKGNLTLYFLDVKGDATLIQYGEYSILVNSGYEEDSKKVLSSIRNLGIDKLNYAFATNTQIKNIGGMPYIILRAVPSTIMESGIPSDSLAYKELYNSTQVIQSDKTIRIGDLILQVMVAYDEGYGFLEETNDNSLVISVRYGNVNFLLMSDCGSECEDSVGVQSDIIKISESCDSTSLAFMQRINPDIAIVSTGQEDFCPSITNRFKYADIPLYMTKDNGDIFITTDGLDYSIGFNKNS